MAVAVSARRHTDRRGTDRQATDQQRIEVLAALQLPASLLMVVLAACGQYAFAVGRNEIRGGVLYGLALAVLGVALYAQSRTAEPEAWSSVSVTRLPRRVADALQAMRSSEDFQALAILFKRVKNIAKELKQDAVLDRGALVEPA